MKEVERGKVSGEKYPHDKDGGGQHGLEFDPGT